MKLLGENTGCLSRKFRVAAARGLLTECHGKLQGRCVSCQLLTLVSAGPCPLGQN